ncbi:MAG: alpha/beta hydrolase [Planctomycetia bacterium]|nr:alpha/beta hydrolase [Planctomycetia bacterium]
MKKEAIFHFVLFYVVIFVVMAIFASSASAQDEYQVWPDKAPGVTENLPSEMGADGNFKFVTTPIIRVFVPEKKTSDACIMILPGGAYEICGNEVVTAKFFAEHGMTAVLLTYRVPRPKGMAKHIPAFQDAQRAIRLTRSLAEKYGFNPDRIGAYGGSAGGHLTTMCCTSSSVKSYEPIDEIDKLPANLAFGIAKYPAYVLEDGRNTANGPDRGNYAKMVDDFVFDAQTCPMCFLHGDSDVYSAMGSVALYHKLRTMNIPAEVHIWAKAHHGFHGVNEKSQNQFGYWRQAMWDWIVAMKLN